MKVNKDVKFVKIQGGINKPPNLKYDKGSNRILWLVNNVWCNTNINILVIYMLEKVKMMVQQSFNCSGTYLWHNRISSYTE